jgi:hypothetical protein
LIKRDKEGHFILIKGTTHQKKIARLGCSLVVQHSPSICEALGLIPNTARKQKFLWGRKKKAYGV